jgi:PAS domain S-box-containing protein
MEKSNLEGGSESLHPRQTSVILDSIADGVYTIDNAWRITSLNRAAEEITGIPREQALGQRCSDVFKSSICESCPMRQTMKTGKASIKGPVYIVDARGGRIPISASYALLKDEKGSHIGGVGTFRDLSLVEELRKQVEERFSFEDIISRNHRMQQLFEILPTISASDSTVLIEGESGTGKELFARAIHHLSPRSRKPFVAINCGALPDTLLESELFGYKAGAFTDARRDKPGRFALAEGGTLFLDEIGDISPALQVRLLRVLQDQVYEPLGATRSVQANVRVLAASNRSLESLVRQGKFRRDLYYRINVILLSLPPLRDRKEDIPLLVDHFVTRFNHLQDRAVVGVSEEVLARLMAYDYPGNVRELENILEHAFVLCSDRLIRPQHLPESVGVTADPSLSVVGRTATVKEMERIMILDALQRNGWNRKAAAQELGFHKSTFFRKIKSFGIELPERDGRTSSH